MAKARGTVSIDEDLCAGCGYCAYFCNQGSLILATDRFNSKGYLIPLFVEPDTCTGCGLCGWMCPEHAIEVFRLTAAAV